MIKNVGHITARHLLSYFITPEAIFDASKKELMKVPGIGIQTANMILAKEPMKKAKAQLEFIRKYQVQVLFFTDDRYPARLKNCIDAPIVLYYRGNADLNHPRIISVVGTRKATLYGKMLCKQLAETLAAYQVLIISGLAYGIDVTAHQESLQNGIPTVGVLAHGLDRIYPQVHSHIARKMVLNGGLLTEFPSDTNPDKENFPRRNRIIAGISDVTVVVEAASKGGALITADIANSYNRDVYAFPGRTTDLSSEGCNFLIKTNRAGLISHASDLADYLGWEICKEKKLDPGVELPGVMTVEEQRILQVLQNSALAIDELALCSELPKSKLALHLLNLEMKGILIALPGNVYQLNQDISCLPIK